jgi:hypothetical protein
MNERDALIYKLQGNTLINNMAKISLTYPET